MAAGGRRRGALEQEVLGCLAAAGRPLTVAAVQADLGGELAYTTVLTALSRLHAKAALTRQPAGRGYAYALPADPAAMGASVTARRMSRLLNSGEDRAGVLARFVADLSPADEHLLTELLADGGRIDEEPQA
jgi:predicted transcriptional regulator